VQPQEHQQSAAKRDAGPTATPRPVSKGTRRGGSDSDSRRRTRAPSASGEAFISSCAKDRNRMAETAWLRAYPRAWPRAARPTNYDC
jgi:hypothetical protein